MAEQLAPLPPPNVSMFERPGILRREWYIWFQAVDLALRELIEDVGALSGPRSNLLLTDGVTPPASADGVVQIYVDSADGDLKARFQGVTKTIVTDT